MNQPLLAVSATFLLMVAIWSLLKFRNWEYDRHHWTVWRYEDPILLFGLILTFTLHGMITSSEYTIILSMAPWLVIGVKLIQHGKEMSLR